MEMEESIFSIMSFVGESRDNVNKALDAAEKEDFKKADELIKESCKSICKAHDVQTTFIQKEAGNDKVPFSVLFVHAQDHLMTAISERETALRLINIYKKIAKK